MIRVTPERMDSESAGIKENATRRTQRSRPLAEWIPNGPQRAGVFQLLSSLRNKAPSSATRLRSLDRTLARSLLPEYDLLVAERAYCEEKKHIGLRILFSLIHLDQERTEREKAAKKRQTTSDKYKSDI